MSSLPLRALLGPGNLLLILVLLLFVPAWSPGYWQGWFFILVEYRAKTTYRLIPFTW